MGAPITVLSFGGGQDSSAILFRLLRDPAERARLAPGKLLVVMSDTGNEHPETYQWLQVIEAEIKNNKHADVEWHLLTKSKGFHAKSWPSLTEFWERTSTIGSKAYPKTCTDKLKIGPIYRFLESYLTGSVNRKKGLKEYAQANGKIRVILGIAKNEEGRQADPAKDAPWMRDSIERVYPLLDWGWDRHTCQVYLQKEAKAIPPPSNCMFCPFISEIELLWLERFHPARLKEWMELEARKIAMNKHMEKVEKLDKRTGKMNVMNLNYGVWGTRRLPEVLLEAKRKHRGITDTDLQVYKMSHGHCSKAKF